MDSGGSTVPDPIARHLLRDEEVVWWGRPAQGLMLTALDIVMVPMSLLWCGFMIFWEVMAWRMGSPPPFLVFGAVFLLIGMFLVFGRFLLDMRLRRLTTYVLTDRRALIARSGPWPSFRAVALDRSPESSLRVGSDGRGTIRFGPPASALGPSYLGRWPGSLVAALDPVPQFLGIEDVRGVFAAIQERSRARS